MCRLWADFVIRQDLLRNISTVQRWFIWHPITLHVARLSISKFLAYHGPNLTADVIRFGASVQSKVEKTDQSVPANLNRRMLRPRMSIIRLLACGFRPIHLRIGETDAHHILQILCNFRIRQIIWVLNRHRLSDVKRRRWRSRSGRSSWTGWGRQQIAASSTNFASTRSISRSQDGVI